jgi:hypothetical protein
MLREQGVDPKELDEIMRRMRELDSERVYRDVEELARLQTFVAEGIKRFEYNRRRQAGADADRAIVAGAETCREFRSLVECTARCRGSAAERRAARRLARRCCATSLQARGGWGAGTGAGAGRLACRFPTEDERDGGSTSVG